MHSPAVGDTGCGEVGGGGRGAWAAGAAGDSFTSGSEDIRLTSRLGSLIAVAHLVCKFAVVSHWVIMSFGLL